MNAPRLKAMAGLPWVPCADIETSGPVEQVRANGAPKGSHGDQASSDQGSDHTGTNGHLALFGWDARKGFAVTRE